MSLTAEVKRLVRQRANDRCEYCHLPQSVSALRLQIEHVIAIKHGGADDDQNLALACIDCNLAKGSNLAGLDPQTGVLTSLFHPRRHLWSEHFAWKGPVLTGLTPEGRTTIVVLNINDEERIEIRSYLLGSE